MTSLNRRKRVVGLLLHVLLGGTMIVAGSPKLLGLAPPEHVERMGLTESIRLVGAGEIITGILLLIPRTLSLGILLTSSFWGGAICVHMTHGESYLLRSALLVVYAGNISPGALLSKDPEELTCLFRLNTLAHLKIAHHFGEKLARRGRGGLLFVGAMGSDKGIPSMVSGAAARAYIQSLAQGLHLELKPLGVHVTVVAAGPTETPVLAKLALTPESMSMKPMKPEQCASEGLKALQRNRPIIVPGRMNRIMNALIPASITRAMMAKMFAKALAGKSAAPPTQAEVR